MIPKLPLAIGHTGLKTQGEKHEIEQKFNGSKYAQGKAKLARRKELSDFERFKVMALRKQARFEVRKSLASAKGKA